MSCTYSVQNKKINYHGGKSTNGKTGQTSCECSKGCEKCDNGYYLERDFMNAYRETNHYIKNANNIVNTNNKLQLTADDISAYDNLTTSTFTTTDYLPTYGLTSTSKTKC